MSNVAYQDKLGLVFQKERIMQVKLEDIELLVERSTVPLFITRGATDIRDRNGSGVLVKIEERYLILTAGHCVEAWLATQTDRFLLLPLVSGPLTVRVICWGHKYEQRRRDFGFLELDADDAGNLIRLGKIFVAKDQMELSDIAVSSEVVISGYPALGTDGEAIKHMLFKGNVLPPQHPPYPENFHVWVSLDELEKVDSGDVYDGPNSQGISGGGCWVVRATQNADSTTVEARLTGIHFCADQGNLAGHKKLEAKVTNHLQLIEETFLGK